MIKVETTERTIAEQCNGAHYMTTMATPFGKFWACIRCSHTRPFGS